MSVDSNKKQVKEPSFNEEQAYFELCRIFAEAVQTQNFNGIEAKIAAWKQKYPIDKFLNPYIIAKIKRILSAEYLEYLLGRELAARILKEKEKQDAAFQELQDIIKTAKGEQNFKKTEREIAKWRKNHSLYSFNKTYRTKILRLISTEYISSITENKKREKAVEEFKRLKSDVKAYDSKRTKEEVDKWMKKFPAEEFHAAYNKEIAKITTESLEFTAQKLTQENAVFEVENALEEARKDNRQDMLNRIPSILAKYNTDKFEDDTKKQILELTRESLILGTAISLQQEISGVSQMENEEYDIGSLSQRAASIEFRKILDKNPHNVTGILDWIHKYRNVNFSDVPKETILTEFMKAG